MTPQQIELVQTSFKKVVPILLVAVSVASTTAGWVFRDARARGLPMRKALTWAVISTQELP